MKNLLLITAFALPLRVFAQGPNSNINPPPQAAQNQSINYYDQINNDDNNMQTNLANPQAQSRQAASGNTFGTSQNDAVQAKAPCKDCDAVKQAVKAAHMSSGSQNGKTHSFKRWAKCFSGKMNMKMKKMFARKYKAKTSYTVCFNW